MLAENLSSTSVLRLGNEVVSVCTLEEAGDPPVDRAVGQGYVERPPSPGRLIQVQVVKRNREYELLIDGVAVERDANGDVGITHHRGLNRAPGNRQLVFSPCAVSMLCEDGERPPSRCSLTILQTTTGIGNQPIGDPLLLDQVDVKTTSILDFHSPVTITSYPLTFSRPPRVVIRDLTAVYKYEIKRMDATFYKVGLLVGPMFVSAVFGAVRASSMEFAAISATRAAVDAQTTVDAAQAALNEAERVAAAAAAVAAADTSITGRLRAAFTSAASAGEALRTSTIRATMGDEFTRVQTAASEATAAADAARAEADPALASAGDEIVKTTLMTGLGAVAVVFMLMNAPISAAALAAIPSVGTGGPLATGSIQVAMKALTSYMYTPAAPEPLEVAITLSELAETLEILSGTTLVQSGADLEAMAKTNLFRREMLVWRWLMERESGGLPFKKAGLYTSNPMMTEQLEIGNSASVKSTLRIDVDDPEHCVRGDPLTWNVNCARDDSAVLGAIASGAVDDLGRLRAAIAKFTRSLDLAISRASATRWYVPTDGWWWDARFFGQLMRFVKRQVPHWRKDQKKDALTGLGIQRKNILQFVRGALQEKLIDKFVSGRDLNVVAFEASLTNARYDMFSGPRTSTGDVIHRHLPHRASGNMNVLFPGPRDVDSEFLDVGSGELVVREYSSLHDARRMMKSTMSSSVSAIRLLLDTWESDSATRCQFVHVLRYTGVIPINDLKKRVPQRPNDSYALVLEQPDDVREAYFTAVLTERERKQIDIVTTRHNARMFTRPRTLLDNVNIPNTEPAFVAMNLFGELLAEEIALVLKLPNFERVEVVQSSVHRAASRLLECASFVASNTKREETGFLQDDDVAFLATRAGRDAHRLRRRMHLPPRDDDTRRRPVVSVRELKEIIGALRKVASLVDGSGSSQLVFSFPSEPLQSLLGDALDGQRAFKRIKECVDRSTIPVRLRNVIVGAVASSFPSNGLLGLVRQPEPAVELLPIRDPIVDNDNEKKRRSLLTRLAELRVDLVGLPVSMSPQTVSQLTDAMVHMNVTHAKPTVFYVPHGFGDSPPPILYPSTTSPMFGSVPVRLSIVIELIGTAVFGEPVPAPPAGTPQSHTIRFKTWPCNDDMNVHPLFIERFNSKTTTVFASMMSAPELVDPAVGNDDVASYEAAGVDIGDVARGFVISDTSRHLSHRVASMAWNAERVLQAACMASESYDGNPIEFVIDLETITRNISVDASRLQVGTETAEELQTTARIFARGHYGMLRSVVASVISLGMIRLPQMRDEEQLRRGREEGEAAPFLPFFGRLDSGDSDDSDTDAFVTGVIFDPTDLNAITRFQDESNPTDADMDIWMERIDEYENAVLTALPLADWSAISESFNRTVVENYRGRFPGFEWKSNTRIPKIDFYDGRMQKEVYDEFVRENAHDLSSLQTYKTTTVSALNRFIKETYLALERPIMARDLQRGVVASTKRARSDLAMASVIGISMASESLGIEASKFRVVWTGAMFDHEDILLRDRANELYNILERSEPVVQALSLAQLCCLVAGSRVRDLFETDADDE